MKYLEKGAGGQIKCGKGLAAKRHKKRKMERGGVKMERQSGIPRLDRV